MYIIVFITAPNKKEARNIAQVLLKAKLAACANIVEKIDSFFWWKGKIDNSPEVLLIAKSKKAKLPGIIKKVKSIHSYGVPEIIALPVIAGSRPYLDWIDESLR